MLEAALKTVRDRELGSQSAELRSRGEPSVPAQLALDRQLRRSWRDFSTAAATSPLPRCLLTMTRKAGALLPLFTAIDRDELASEEAVPFVLPFRCPTSV